MGEAVWTALFMMAFACCSAMLDLSGVHEVKGTWMGSTTLPCTYMPSEGFTQQTLSWSLERDRSSSTIFRRDSSGDHVLLARFRERVSIPRDSPGNASLLIQNLEMPDSGHYTCQITWRSENNSLVTKEVTTTVKVAKVAVTKPIIRASELGLKVPAGASTSLTCEASGSPPIRYRWFKSTSEGKALLLSSQAELAWDNLHPSDSGVYYCEAENRVGAGTVQQSDAVELTVTGAPWGAYPSHLYALAAALGVAALGALLVAILCRWRQRRRRDKEDSLYEVAFHGTASVTRLETHVEVPPKCLLTEANPKTSTSSDTPTTKDKSHSGLCLRKSPEYENLLTAMESEYEIEFSGVPALPH
ncbi:V-set and immunoglobulin domain-containing protein 4-like [Melanerpes formicivorus]|uniref:V-set and immunoglobulin domain-containing protein 4-like n=1 Tax=Melanerpes formicivorus TaxID=211600 RepID=UPI00358F6697